MWSCGRLLKAQQGRSFHLAPGRVNGFLLDLDSCQKLYSWSHTVPLFQVAPACIPNEAVSDDASWQGKCHGIKGTWQQQRRLTHHLKRALETGGELDGPSAVRRDTNSA